MTKIGRNDPCFCGSGKKFKRCHLNDTPLVVEHFMKGEREKARLLEQGIRINYVNPVEYQGRRVWGLGSRLYYNRPPRETFHEFIVFVLQQALGREWWEREKAATDKHYLMTCFDSFRTFKQRNATAENREPDGRWSAVPDGHSRYLSSVAFDVCTLMHTGKLPEPLLQRLRDRAQFQGARYEIGIAAVFARLGYSIQFLDDPSLTTKHCEFFATNSTTGESIAVEAKSRHRAGVLNTPGSTDEPRLLRGDIARHLREAAGQAPGDRPFLIFVDVNVPPSGPEIINQTWRPEILRIMNEHHVPGPGAPTTFTAVYVTNFPYHFEGEMSAGRNEILEIVSPMPGYKISDSELNILLERALKHYGEVPSFDVDGVLGWER